MRMRKLKVKPKINTPGINTRAKGWRFLAPFFKNSVVRPLNICSRMQTKKEKKDKKSGKKVGWRRRGYNIKRLAAGAARCHVQQMHWRDLRHSQSAQMVFFLFVVVP